MLYFELKNTTITRHKRIQMRGLFILVVIGAVLCSIVDVVNAKALHLNVTVAAANCPAGGSVSCAFTDPKYWDEQAVPADGDDVFISEADVVLVLSTPLRLASLMINATAPSYQPVGTTITVNATTLTLDTLNSAGFVTLVNGYLVVGASMRQPGSMMYAFSGTVNFTDFTAEWVNLNYDSFSAGNIYASKGLSTSNNVILRCQSVVTQTFVTGYGSEVFCNSINVTASDVSINSMTYFMGPVVADKIYIGGYAKLVATSSTIQVTSFKVDAFVDELVIDNGALISTTPLIFEGNILHFRLAGGITTPTMLLSNINSGTIGSLTVQGDANFSNLKIELANSFVVKGNVSFARTELTLPIHYVKGQQPNTLDHPVIDIQGHLDEAQINLKFELDYFANPPQNSSTLIHYFSGNTANFVLNGPELTSFDVTSTSIGFKWAWPQSPSVNSPSGSGNNLGSELSKLDIGLIVACAILVVVVIALIIALIKKRNPNYEQIRN